MINQAKKQIVLASASPRREDLLKQIGLNFLIHPSDFEEKSTHLTAEELAIHNAMGKAQKVANHYKNAIIIGVDTVVVLNDEFLGKPLDNEHAAKMLRLLSNTTHKVISAICLIDTKTNKNLSATQTTLVTMDRLDEAQIAAYIASGEGKDKAAGYAVQGIASLFVKKIEGDYFNVVGLPIYLLRKMLKKLGINLI